MRKYKLPSNHDLFLDRTLHDHLVDFYIDKFESKPLEAHRNVDGEIQFTDTGDAVVDRWEEQIAKGEIPDLMEAFDDASLNQLARIRAQAEARDPYTDYTMGATQETVATQLKQQEKTEPGFDRLKHAMLSDVPTFGFTEDEDD